MQLCLCSSTHINYFLRESPFRLVLNRFYRLFFPFIFNAKHHILARRVCWSKATDINRNATTITQKNAHTLSKDQDLTKTEYEIGREREWNGDRKRNIETKCNNIENRLAQICAHSIEQYGRSRYDKKKREEIFYCFSTLHEKSYGDRETNTTIKKK